MRSRGPSHRMGGDCISLCSSLPCFSAPAQARYCAGMSISQVAQQSWELCKHWSRSMRRSHKWLRLVGTGKGCAES
eukprot:11566916-Alexandrium_andersonii.AAC.1